MVRLKTKWFDYNRTGLILLQWGTEDSQLLHDTAGYILTACFLVHSLAILLKLARLLRNCSATSSSSGESTLGSDNMLRRINSTASQVNQPPHTHTHHTNNQTCQALTFVNFELRTPSVAQDLCANAAV